MVTRGETGRVDRGTHPDRTVREPADDPGRGGVLARERDERRRAANGSRGGSRRRGLDRTADDPVLEPQVAHVDRKEAPARRDRGHRRRLEQRHHRDDDVRVPRPAGRRRNQPGQDHALADRRDGPDAGHPHTADPVHPGQARIVPPRKHLHVGAAGREMLGQRSDVAREAA